MIVLATTTTATTTTTTATPNTTSPLPLFGTIPIFLHNTFAIQAPHGSKRIEGQQDGSGIGVNQIALKAQLERFDDGRLVQMDERNQIVGNDPGAVRFGPGVVIGQDDIARWQGGSGQGDNHSIVVVAGGR